MNYEINVSRRITKPDGSTQYRHFFATHPRSCTTFAQACDVAEKLDAAFPEPEYKISASLRRNTGADVTDAIHAENRGQ